MRAQSKCQPLFNSMKLHLLIVLLNTVVFAQDDQLFWERFLKYDYMSLSIPTKPPVKPPPPSPVAPPAPCEVEVSIGCKSSDETTTCKEIKRPNPVCSSGSGFSILQFQLDAGSKCTPAGNSQGAFCKDCANFTGSIQNDLLVLCKNAATGEDLRIVPSRVPPRGIFTIEAPVGSSVLPNSIDCIYIEGENTKIQQIIINTSGNAALNLKEDFGAFTLLSCDAGPPGGANVNTCLETISYDIGIKNSGSVAVDVTTLDFDLGGISTSLLGEIENTIVPGVSSTLSILLLIDLCFEREICAEVTLEAKPANGSVCKATDEYCFETSNLPPVPIKPPVLLPTKKPPVPYSAPIPVPTKTPPVPYPIPVSVPYQVPVIPTIIPPVPYYVPVVAPTVKPPVPFNVPVVVPVAITPVKIPVSVVSPTAPTSAPKSKDQMGSMSMFRRN